MPSRILLGETLDELGAEDPRAQRSRRDLQRVNAFMGSAGILRRALARWMPGKPGRPLRMLELGAGDGTLLLRIARVAASRWPPVQLQLLDRVALLSPATRAAYARLGWQAEPLTTDVQAWIHADSTPYDLIITNLFLHHFAPDALAELLGAVSARCSCFLACEPRRSALALGGSHLVVLLGANEVTRNDAVLSVRAGFRDAELSRQWPGPGPRVDARSGAGAGAESGAALGSDSEWELQERAAGPFCHFFGARRRAAAGAR